MSDKHKDMGDYSSAWPRFAYQESCKGDVTKGKRVLNNILQDIQNCSDHGSILVSFDKQHEHQFIARVRSIGFKEKWKVYWADEWAFPLYISANDVSYVIDRLKYLGYNVIADTKIRMNLEISWK